MLDGDLNLTHFNKDNYRPTWASAVLDYAALLLGLQKKALKVCSASAGKQRSSMSKYFYTKNFKSNQSRRSLAFTDAERATKRQINKRERGKMFSQLFYERNVKWPTIIFSEANYSTCFSNMPNLRVTEKEMKCKCFNYLHLFVPTNNETVNLVLLQKHVYY